MSKKQIYPKLRLKKLVLVGERKNYEVDFLVGLNIIYGDSDTGKSSILNLVDYCLGAKSIYLYPEMQDTGKYVLLELTINGKLYTIKRDIINNLKELEVFTTSIEKMDEIFPQFYYPQPTKKGEFENFSDFLLNNLGFTTVRNKKNIGNDEPKISSVGFRDIFKYCYLDQDGVGSKQLIESNNDFSLTASNQDIFKYIFNILDGNIAGLKSEIKVATKQREDLNKEYKAVSGFLRSTQLESYEQLINSRENVDNDLFRVSQEINVLNSSMISDSDDHDYLRVQIAESDVKLQELIAQLEINEIQIRNNIRLKKEYSTDIQKISGSLEILEKVSGPTDHKFLCPLCSTEVAIDNIKDGFDHYEKKSLDKEVKNLKKRLNEIDQIIQAISEENEAINFQIFEVKGVLYKLRVQLDNESTALVSPFLTQVEKLVSAKATLQESKKSLDYLIKVRASLVSIEEKTVVIDNKITILNSRMSSLKDAAPTTDIIIEKVSDYLLDFLKKVKFKNAFGININAKTFMPIIRSRDYQDLSSGGARTLVSIGYIISLLQYGLNQPSSHPKLIMLDTVWKYLGKTSSKYKDTDKASDIAEGIIQGDASKYTEMYRYFVNLTQSEENFQMIIVDNDLPEDLEDSLQKFVIKHFDEDGKNGLPKGFIDDVA